MCGGKKDTDGPRTAAQNIVKSNEAAERKAMAASTTSSSGAGAVAGPKRVPTKKFLEAIMASPELSNCLEIFLRAEFCLENLQFLQIIAKYREACKTGDVESQATRTKLQTIRDDIQKNFMLPTSDTEVNIPAKIKRECLITVEQLRKNGSNMDIEEYKKTAFKVYDTVDEYVKNVLVRERIGRFLTTEVFIKTAAKFPHLGQ